MKKLTDRLQGKPSIVRWVAKSALVWPLQLVRFAFIGVVAGLWAYHAPRVAESIWNAVAAVESPNKQRTPKKRRAWQSIDGFDDVRVRISELTQSPKQ